MKRQLVRISVLQSSKVLTALYVLLGFVYTIIGIPMLIFGDDKLRIIGVFYILGPIWMGLIGFIFFAVFAALYNLMAKWLGGVEVEIKNVE